MKRLGSEEEGRGGKSRGKESNEKRSEKCCGAKENRQRGTSPPVFLKGPPRAFEGEYAGQYFQKFLLMGFWQTSQLWALDVISNVTCWGHDDVL